MSGETVIVNGNIQEFVYAVGQHCSKTVLEYIHINVRGASLTLSCSRKLYYISFIRAFIENYSRFVWIYVMVHKSNVFAIFKK